MAQRYFDDDFLHEPLSAVRLIELLIQLAHEARASDIHLDPSEEVLAARIRIHGELQDVVQLPIHIHREIIARLKILAGLRIDEHQSPQDGRFRFSLHDTDYLDVRVSIAPTYYGENAVLRLLSVRNGLTTLSSLGLSAADEAKIRRALARPHGLILVTGPTGSGKTSTLYSLLQIRNTRKASIITIEDPVEYAIEGVNQIQANTQAGLTFAEGLRSILRQDPNVIGIGEIRDQETAGLAIHASLTGHLVLSTLHATNAPGALPRLVDMGIEPYLTASTVSMVISQRLVKKLCPTCRIPRQITQEQSDVLSRYSFEPDVAYVLLETYYVALGCDDCHGTGVSGRIGLFEICEINGVIRDAVNRKASGHELSEIACAHGMVPMFADGLQKAAEGLIALDEALSLAYE